MPLKGSEPPRSDDWPYDQGEDALLLLAVAQAVPSGFERHVGVAVSGGGDSVALLHLMSRLCRHQGVSLSSVTVDHALRSGSASEAAMAGALCATLGVPHQILRWDHGPITGNLMDTARRARMDLIAGWARATGVTQVALGHTADDRAETFLMALYRSAGLDGLVGLRQRWHERGIAWSRPLLSVSRTDLRLYLTRHGVVWAEDPTNDDAAFERVRMRRAMATLADLGIDAGRIGMTASHLQSAKDALDATLRKTIEALVHEVAGALRIDREGFEALPPDLQRQMLTAGIGWLSGNPAPRREEQATLLGAARDGRTATLHGCRLQSGADHLLLSREPKAAGGAVPVGALWDGRWIVDGPAAEVRALGTEGLPQVKDWRATGIPRNVLIVTPGIWDGDTLLAAPLARMSNGWTARIVAGFGQFPTSH